MVTCFFFRLVPNVKSSPDSVEKPPSAYGDLYWLNPEGVYADDDVTSWASTDERIGEWLDFSFEDDLPSSITVDSVNVTADGSVSLLNQEVWCKVSWDGGTTWSESPKNFELPFRRYESKTVDVTGDTDWTREKLTNENFMVRLLFIDYLGEGCFTNKTYFVSWDESLGIPFNSTHPEYAFLGEKNPWILKNIEKANVGDWVLVSSHDEGIRLEKIAQVDKHFGEWTIFDVWSGETKIKYKDGEIEKEYEWKKHTRVTGNHPSLVFRDGSWIRVCADEILETDQIRHLWHEEIEFEEGELNIVPLKDHSLVTGDIDRIDVSKITDLVYDIHTDNQGDWVFMTTVTDDQMEHLQMLSQKFGVDLGAYFDPPPQQGKWTGYVDYLTVTVEYTEVEGEEEIIDCNWIGINNTVAGDPTEFKADFTDLNESDGLSHFRCLHNNTGTLVNTTWSDSWVGNWSIIELTLNSTGGLTIAFRFYVNDTGGTEHESTWCFFPTHSPASDDGWGAGGYDYDPTGNFWVDGWMINIALPTWDLWVNRNPNIKGIGWTIIVAVCIILLIRQILKHPKIRKVKVFQE